MNFVHNFVNNLVAAFASSELGRAIGGGEVLGPEIALPFSNGGWAVVSGAGVTVDASGVHFVNAANIATVGFANAGIANDTLYKVQITIANVGAPNNGTWQCLLYGTTNNHVAQPANVTLANGVITFYASTINTASATTNAIRLRCSGTTGNNNFDITAISVKRVLSQ